jgi:type IV fimbrial biogenesis protein FimT
MAARHPSNGFTLVEMMVVVALAAVIFAIAAPSFTEFRRNNRLTAVANELLGAIQTARTEAIKRQASVAVCPSDNPEAMAALCTTGPFRGWIAFVDPNNDCMRDPADPTERVVRVGARIDDVNSEPLFPAANGNCVSFGASGFLQTTISNRPAASHVLFCDRRSTAEQSGSAGQPLNSVRGIEVTPTGRARITRNKAEIEKWAADPLPVSCPTGRS